MDFYTAITLVMDWIEAVLINGVVAWFFEIFRTIFIFIGNILRGGIWLGA